MARSDKNTQVGAIPTPTLPKGEGTVQSVHAEKINVGAKNLLPVQSENNSKKSPMAARRRYLERLREAYAEEIFSKLLNEFAGTLRMKVVGGVWRLSFSCGHENGMVQAKGKTLAHALINLASKSPSLGGVWGGTSKTTAL